MGDPHAVAQTDGQQLGNNCHDGHGVIDIFLVARYAELLNSLSTS